MGQEFSSITHNEQLDDSMRGGFSDKQRDGIRAKFLEKTKGKGTLDLTAFCALAGMGQKMGKKVFDLFDMDGDGLIDDYEFICGLALFTKTNVKQRMEAIFEIFDVNRSQTIDKEEFTDLVAGLMRLNSSTDLEPTALEKKKSDLKTSYFLESDYVTKDQFASMATADEDLRKSLINIGIISNQELGTGDHDADLDEELKKFVENEKMVGKIDNITNAVEPLDDTGFAVENVGEGDQFMAVKPYLGVVRNSVPSNFKRDPKDSEAPNASLELHYVHGYRCHDTRNNIFYNPDGNLVYHTGLMGIQLNTRENTQRFVDDNTNDIMCMDTWNELSATGDIGNKPTLVLWNNTTMETYCVYAGEMRKGIAMVAFSADGQKLACGCMDSDNTIFILNVNELKVGNRAKFLQSKFKGPRDMLLDLKWSRDGTLLAAATKSGIYFCETNGTAWKVSRSSGNKIDKCVMTLCYLGNEFLAGVFDGKIYRVRGKDVGQYLDAHKSAVNCMFASSNGKGFLSGGNDGKVIVWDDALTKKRTIDLTTVRDFLITNPRVRAVSESKDGKKIVIGTRSSNIIEVEASGAMRCVNNGHFDKELWGLAVIPRSEEFITCGEDSLLAKWNLKDRRLVKSAKLPYMATTCDVSKDCRYVAVGCKNGFTLIFDVNNFTEVKQITDRKAEISVLKFSPDCKLLAVGGNDSKVRLYSTNGFKFTKLLSGNSSRVTHLDWSLDSSVVMTNSSGYEILFYDAIKGEQNTSGASAYRDEKWDNWTCVLGWPVQGIFPAYSDGTDVNTCCRTADCSMIATVDDFGKVNLYKYPSYMPKAAHSAFVGHSSHVTNVVFSANEDYAITTGGNDKAIIQWKFRNHSKLQNSEEEEDQPVDVSGFDANEFASKTNVVDKNDGQVVAPKPEESPIDLGDGFIEEDLGEGDQRMAVLPFLGEVKNSVPSNWKLPPRAGDPPAGNLKIRHAFGYRCHDAKDTCKFTADSNIIAFITAALGITMNVNTLVQDFFNVHDEDLISFDISPCKRYCATGQMPAKGKSRNIDCYVWDTITKAPLVKLSGQHRGGIRHVKFSPNSNLLLTVGMDDDNSFVVYDWQNKKILCQSKVDKSFVFDCDWQDDAAFCTITKDAIKFWSIKGGGCSSMKGSWGKETKGVLASCKYAGNVCFTGSWKGEIIPWSGGSKGKTISAHSGGVFALHYDRKTNTLFSGGKDGRVIAWTVTGSSLNMKEEVISARDVQSLGSSGILCNLGIRSLDYHPDGKLLVGSKNGCIFIKNFKATTEETRFNPIMAAHFEGEVWGLACHPSNGKFVTCGGDFSIRIFNAITRADEGMYFHSKDCRAVDWSSDGNLIVLGSSDAEILLFDERMEKDPFIIQSSFAKGGKQWIEEIKFSPDCKYVAFGAHGGASKLEVMEVVGDRLEKRYNFFVGLTSALLHLDWSTDSQSIVLNSLAYELKFVNVHGKNVMAASASKDIDWATWTCKFGFPVQGIFEGVDFSDINTVCRSNNRQVLATGDDFQKVRLLKYPCIVPKAGCKRYTAHSSHVTRVRFGCNDNMLVSIGGNDKTAIVWTTDFGGEDPSKAALLSTAASMSPGRNHSLGQAGQNDDEVDEAEILGIYEPEVVEGAQSAPGASPHQAQTGGEGQDNDLGGFQQEDMGEGDQFMAVLPWLGAIKFPPSNYDAAKWKINGTKKPNVKLTLEHVHGYRSKDKRNNIFVLASGEVAYYAASVAIVHDVSKNVQRFFNQHTDKILSMDVHPDRKTIATGENGAKPMVYVWDSETMAVRFKIKAGAILKSVDTLTFSPSGKFLLATMADDDHMLNLMSVGGASGQELSVIAKEKGGRDVILGVTWRSDAEFVAIGIKLYKVCTVSGSAIKGAKGDFGNGSNFLVSVAFIRQTGDVVCGTAVGEVQLWRGTSIAKVEKNVHKGMVDGLYAGSNCVMTGGKDGHIQIFSLSLERLERIDLNTLCPNTFSSHIRAINADENSRRIIVGLFSQEIHQFTYSALDRGSKWNNAGTVVQSHYAPNLKWNNEIWGLSTMPNKDTYMTCGDDGTLRMWSISQRKMIAAINLNVDNKGILTGPNPKTKDLVDSSKLRTIDVNPSGNTVAVGSVDGTLKFVAIDQTTLKFRASFKAHDKWIGDIKFSPDNTKMATGGHDSKLKIYSISPLKLLGTSGSVAHSAVDHIDWSVDSNYLHVNTQDYELLFFKADKCQQLTSGASALKDEDYATWTAKLGWPVQGIWRSEYKGSDINCCVRSKKSFDTGYRLFAVGTDFKTIQLYRYPVLVKNSECNEFRAHGSHLTRMRFSNDDSYLLSIGGEDQCTMQWRVEPTN